MESVPSDILEHERSLYILSLGTPISAKQAVFETRYPGIGWAQQVAPFPGKPFTSFVSSGSIWSGTSSPYAKKNTYSPRVSSGHGVQGKKNAVSYTEAKSTRPPQSSTSTASLPLFRHATAAHQPASSKPPTNVSKTNTVGWMGSASTK